MNNSPAIVDLQPVARNEDEQHDDADTDQDRRQQDHRGPFVHQFADIRLSYPGPIHEGVFTEADESEDRVDGVLL